MKADLDHLIPEFSVRLGGTTPLMSPSLALTKPTGLENSATSLVLPFRR
jgi:hypothetical protein